MQGMFCYFKSLPYWLTIETGGSIIKSKYSQIWVQRPPFGPKNSGCCWQVVAIRRWSLAQLWLYLDQNE